MRFEGHDIMLTAMMFFIIVIESIVLYSVRGSPILVSFVGIILIVLTITITLIMIDESNETFREEGTEDKEIEQ